MNSRSEGLTLDQLEKLKGNYFWDGKRMWKRISNPERFVSYRLVDAKLHLRGYGFKNPTPALDYLKQNCHVDAALPMALHAVGDVIIADGAKILCTDDFSASKMRKPGAFPFISEILDRMLGEQRPHFQKWLAKAYRYGHQISEERPAILCLVGACPSGKGLIARIANLTLAGLWRPSERSVVCASRASHDISEINQVVQLMNLTGFSGYASEKRRVAKLLNNENELIQFRGFRVRVRQVNIIRCHNQNWPQVVKHLARITENQLIELHAPESFSLKDGNERMSSEVVCHRTQSEIQQFRHHVLSDE